MTSCWAGGGDDVLYGGDGPDGLYGHSGNDILYGDAGNDYLDGGDGNDVIYALADNDTVYGRQGNDTINAGDQAVVYGGLGDDFIDLRYGSTTSTGNMGNDQFRVTFAEDQNGQHKITDYDVFHDHLLIRGLNSAGDALVDLVSITPTIQAPNGRDNPGWTHDGSGNLVFDISRVDANVTGTVTLLGVTDFPSV